MEIVNHHGTANEKFTKEISFKDIGMKLEDGQRTRWQASVFVVLFCCIEQLLYTEIHHAIPLFQGPQGKNIDKILYTWPRVQIPMKTFIFVKSYQII